MPQLPIQFLRYSTSVNVGTWHAARDSNFVYVYGRRLIKRWQRKLDGKIAVSAAAVKHVEQYFPGYYNIIPNGVDIEHFATDVSPLAEFADGKCNVLFVGRPEKRKGLKYLIRAFVGVQRAIPDSRLIVVGAGDFGRYESAVRRAQLRDVVFRSHVPFDELPDITTARTSFARRILDTRARASCCWRRWPPGFQSLRRTSMGSPVCSRTASRACSSARGSAGAGGRADRCPARSRRGAAMAAAAAIALPALQLGSRRPAGVVLLRAADLRTPPRRTRDLRPGRADD